MKMIKERTCPKCGSKNVYLDFDSVDWCEHCLLCGFSVMLNKLKPPIIFPPTKEAALRKSKYSRKT